SKSGDETALSNGQISRMMVPSAPSMTLRSPNFCASQPQSSFPLREPMHYKVTGQKILCSTGWCAVRSMVG
ncbi:hypothetical protein, partial [Neokomagataea anthophila]